MKVGIGRNAPTWMLVMLCATLGLRMPFANATTLPYLQPQLKLYDVDGNMIEPRGEALALAQERVMEKVGDSVVRMLHPDLSEEEVTLPQYRIHQSKKPITQFSVYGILNSSGVETTTSEFQITIEDPNGLQDSQPAIEAAFQVVANGWTSKIPVKVKIHFAASEGFLIKAQSVTMYMMDDVYYTSAIYDYITGKDNDMELFDIDMEINPFADWSIVDGTLSETTYDFQSVIIRETQHGLYLRSFYGVTGNGQGTLIGGKQTVFDRFVAVNPTFSSDTDQICGVVGYFGGDTNITSEEVHLALTSDRLFFMVGSPVANGYYNLYAPSTYVQGLSVVHVDPFMSAVFDQCDYLLYYKIETNTSIRCIGEVVSRISFACRTSGLRNSDLSTAPPCEPGSFLSVEPTQTPEPETASPSFPSNSPSSVLPTELPSPLQSLIPSETPEASFTPFPSATPMPSSDEFVGGTPSEYPDEFVTESPVESSMESPTPSPSESSSETPIESPSESPSESSTASPSTDTNSDSDPCFPADALVQLLGGKSARMDELDIGDRVLVRDNKYSDIYLFGHRVKPSDDKLFSFVRLMLNADQLSVELSDTHLVWANQRCCIPAADVKLGDELFDVSSGRWMPVIRIERVRKPGLYNPHTMTGDIVVNGVLVSTYNQVVHPKLGHWLLAPERWVYELTMGRTSLLNGWLELRTPAVLQWILSIFQSMVQFK